MVRQPALRRHHPALLRAPGGRAARHDPQRLHGGARGRRRVPRAPAPALRRAQEHHHLRSLLARPGGDDEAHGDRGDLPRRLGDLGQGLDQRGSGARSGELPAEPGARRGGGAGARAAHRRPQPAVPALADGRGAARGDPRGRLSALHHRRRRHRPRRRPARAQPDPALRRGRRARLPHRGPAAGHQEVRPPGRQGPGLVGRADQAAERRALPARRHARAGHHRRAHRRRGRDPARRPRRRARPAVHPRRHQPRAAELQGGVPRADAPFPRGGRARAQRPPALRARRRGACRRRCLARARGASASSSRTARRPRPIGAAPAAEVLFDKTAGTRTRSLGGRGRAADLRRGRRRADRVPRRARARRSRSTPKQWREFARNAGFYAARERARALGVSVPWDCEQAKTPEGYYQVRGGIPYAIAKSLAVAPFADILWMETKTADLEDARTFADAIHAASPTRCSPTTSRRRSTGTRPG